MDTTCFIHIGLHKTGSTTIQQLLLHNQEGLRKLGFYRPITGTETYRHSHHDLALEIDGTRSSRKTRLIEKLAREIKAAGKPKAVVISAETLSRNIGDPAMLDRLADFAAGIGCHPHVVAYVRPQPQTINSAFTQLVKMWRAPENFEDFFQSRLADRALDYAALFAPLLTDRRFTVTVRPYNKAVVAEGVCADFLSVLELPPSAAAAFDTPRDYNVSPGPKTIAAMRQIARRLDAASGEIAAETLAAMSRPIIAIADGHGWNATRFDGINQHRLKAALARYGESNEAFAQAAWSRSWYDMFPEEKDRRATPNMFRPGEASEAERAEFREFVDETIAAMRELADNPDAAAILPPGEEI